MNRYTTSYYKNRLLVGFNAIIDPNGPDRFLVSKHVRYYWKKRILKPGWKAGKQGGARNVKFTEEQRKGLYFIIQKKLTDAPHTSFDQIIRYAKQFGYHIAKSELSTLLKRWRWSLKIPSEEQIQKYSIQNIEYYANFILKVRDIPWYRLKYLDESHFRASELHPTKLWSPVGERIKATRKAALDMGYSLTILTALSIDNPIKVDLRYKTNTQFDFYKFVHSAVETKFLQPGDILIVDNARIHFAEETAEVLDFLVRIHNIRIINLPTYSCELNPCELVFNYVKARVRSQRDEMKAFWIQILRAVAEVNILHLYQWYDHCINCV